MAEDVTGVLSTSNLVERPNWDGVVTRRELDDVLSGLKAQINRSIEDLLEMIANQETEHGSMLNRIEAFNRRSGIKL